MATELADVERRLNSLERIVVPRREHELVAKGLADELESTEEALDRRISAIENSMKWAFRMVAAAFVGFLFQGIIVLMTLIGRH